MSTGGYLTETQLKRAQEIAAQKNCSLAEAVAIVQQGEARTSSGTLDETDLPRLRAAKKTKEKTE
jgi:hypothetical protein